jgi:hypothetical protein
MVPPDRGRDRRPFPAYGAPRDFRVEQQRNRLVMSRGPALKGGLPWTLGVLAIGLAVVGIVYHFQPIAGTAVLALFLLVYSRDHGDIQNGLSNPTDPEVLVLRNFTQHAAGRPRLLGSNPQKIHL